jgi:hypothetical protein
MAGSTITSTNNGFGSGVAAGLRVGAGGVYTDAQGNPSYIDQSTGQLVSGRPPAGYDPTQVPQYMADQGSTFYGDAPPPSETVPSGSGPGLIGQQMQAAGNNWLAAPQGTAENFTIDPRTGAKLVNNGDGTATYGNPTLPPLPQGDPGSTVATNVNNSAVTGSAGGLIAPGLSANGVTVPAVTGGGNTKGANANGANSAMTVGTAPIVNADGSITPGTGPTIAAGTPGSITAPGYSAATVGVTPDMTVQGQLMNVLAGENPATAALLQNAQTGANQASNGGGLLHSSMADQAADQAMLNVAEPIAAADAQTYAQTASENQAALNQAYSTNAQLASTANVANLNSSTQNAIAWMQSQTNLAQETMSTQSAQAVATLNAQAQVQVAKVNTSNQMLIQTSASAASAYNQYLTDVQNVLGNNTTDAATKQSELTELQNDINASLTTIGSIAGVTLPQISGAGAALAQSGGAQGAATTAANPYPSGTPGNPG